jgi:hypothetical protein
MRIYVCREAYKALDIRNKQVTAGLGLAITQHRQLLQDVSMADPKQARVDHIMSEGIGGQGQCLDLSTHDAWASTSPLVRRDHLQYLDAGQVRIV